MLNFRGEDPNQILKLVREVERNSTILHEHVLPLNGRPRRAAYFHNSTWLKVRKKNEKCFNLPALRSSFRFLVKGRFRTAVQQLYAGHKKICDTEIVATYVRVKNNVLSLYPELGLACKIRRPNSFRDAESLCNEYVVLKKAQDFMGLNAPEPIAFQKEPAPALWLKYVDERKVNRNERAVIAFRIAESLFGWYAHNGIETIRANMYAPLVQILDRGISGLKEQGWREPDAAVIHTTLTSVADSKIPLVVSQIHGDASIGNSMVSRDDVLIITDWENSRWDLVAYDIRKLKNTNSKIEHRYSEWLATKVDLANLNTKNELELTVVLSNIDLNKKRHYLSGVSGYSEQNTEARLKAIRRQVLDACAMLNL